MCLTPIHHSDGKVFACRDCNACIETRLNAWVSRALAESVVAGHTYAITMTYADLPNGHRPIGATVFDYSDIQRFLKRLRFNYHRLYGGSGQIRYIACGEQGSKGTQRVHWHIILFSQNDIRPATEWVDFETQKPVAPENVMMDTNYNTDVWPHGHILLQTPNAKGIRYALKYALKQQFGAAKSEGTNRLPKSENWAASFFKMSKKPPIGLPYLIKICDDAERGSYVYPSTKLRVPTIDGYWQPSGLLEQYFLDRMHHINARIRRDTGRDAPQWESLVSEYDSRMLNVDLTKQVETLHYGQNPQGGGDQEAFSPASRRAVVESQVKALRAENDAKAFQRSVGARHAVVVRRCGSLGPCLDCFRGLSAHDKAESRRLWRETIGQWWSFADPEIREKYQKPFSKGFVRYFDATWRRFNPYPSPFCSLAGSDEAVSDAFAWAQQVHRAAEVLGPDAVKAKGFAGSAPGVSGGRAARIGDGPIRSS